ncbi:ATP-binding protein [Kordiimonas sp.]|uniref:PAS domain-containing sensor histidine kinase n=1 Tax=Kordiimonas sp. TaxID=1970157 RepID=UPI003A90BDB1
MLTCSKGGRTAPARDAVSHLIAKQGQLFNTVGKRFMLAGNRSRLKPLTIFARREARETKSKRRTPVTVLDSALTADPGRFFESALNSLSAHIAIIDSEGTIRWVNGAWNDFALANGGQPERASVGQNYLHICQTVPAAQDPSVSAILDGIRGVIDHRRPEYYVEYPCDSPEEQRWFMMRAKPLDLAGSGLFIISHHTITERKQAEQELQRSEAALRYEVDVKNRFFSIIAHDLKDPFASLLSMAQTMVTMADSVSKDRLVEFAGLVKVSGDEVFALLENLLNWARLQLDGPVFRPKSLALGGQVRDCVNVLRPVAMAKDIILTNDVGTATVYADQDMVLTVLRNLISNALKFTPPGGTIGISACHQDGFVRVTVRDSGVGLSEDQQAHLFALDARNSTQGTQGERGTGLGLPLCKEMVEHNGGQLWVDSSPGEGTAFHFTLPPGS